MLEAHDVLLVTIEFPIKGQGAALPYIVLVIGDLEVFDGLCNSLIIFFLNLDDTVNKR